MNRWLRLTSLQSRRSSAICVTGISTNRVPILLVTHNREEVFALGDEVVILEAGRIVAQGQPHEVMRAPQLETAAHLSGFETYSTPLYWHFTKIAAP